MAGGVDQVQLVVDPFVMKIHLDGVALDRDAAFPLQVHVVEHLVLHVLAGDGAGDLQQPVGQGALTMVDMGDNAEIADVLHAEQRYLNIS